MKKSSSTPFTVLILGIDGMLGRFVYNYFKNITTIRTFGTTRKHSNIDVSCLYLSVESFLTDIQSILDHTKKLDVIINCIGARRDSTNSVQDYIKINALFPNELTSFLRTKNIRLIHVSTDAVFGENNGKSLEISIPSPSDLYGSSKFLGEVTGPHTITIRTSILGFDPNHHAGLLEQVMNESTLSGYTNQRWSGCTALQFAKLCEYLLSKKIFRTITKKTPLIHFAPIGPTTKYVVLQSAAQYLNTKTVINKSANTKITRYLCSIYPELIPPQLYHQSLRRSLLDLISYEKKYITYKV